MRLLRIMPYEGIKIYLTHERGKAFRYYFFKDDEFYVQEVQASPKGKKHTGRELASIQRSLMTGAMMSIDKLDGKDVAQEAIDDYDKMGEEMPIDGEPDGESVIEQANKAATI